jgi:hypothetical protein
MHKKRKVKFNFRISLHKSLFESKKMEKKWTKLKEYYLKTVQNNPNPFYYRQCPFEYTNNPNNHRNSNIMQNHIENLNEKQDIRKIQNSFCK